MDRLGAALARLGKSSSESVVVTGASNLAARRAAKANRRKAIVAQKRKAEAAGSTPAGQVARAAALPVRDCLCTENLFEIGMGTLTLARGSTAGSVVVGACLLDTFCRGVKDVMIRTMSGEEFEAYVDKLDDATPLVPVDPGHARKLLRDLTRWSGSLGFQPHRDFATVERLFGDVDPQACDTTFEFGMNGKPLYTSGPGEASAASRRDVEQLRAQLGPDGFHYMVAV
ncbi:MAG: hypothetical protein ABSC95_25040 [Acetobacteraceae bacterium]|jgi:hypothetical protein